MKKTTKELIQYQMIGLIMDGLLAKTGLLIIGIRMSLAELIQLIMRKNYTYVCGMRNIMTAKLVGHLMTREMIL